MATLIFDWSGTIMDNLHLFFEVFKKISKELGGPEVPVEELRRTFTIPYMKFWNHYFPDLTHEKEHELFTRFINEGDPPEVHKGVPEVLAFLKEQGHTLLVLSADPPVRITAEAQRAKITQFFDHFETDIHEKDEALLRMIKEKNLNPKECYYIGDTSGDVEAGKTAGMKTIGATWGWQLGEIVAASSPDILLNSFEELRSVKW